MYDTKPQVTGLPPTIGVQDPAVRQYLDALTNAWNERSGNRDPNSGDRFITAAEFQSMASQAVVDVLGTAINGPGYGAGGPGGAGGSGPSVADLISSLSDEIKRSILYQLLGTEFESVDLSDIRQRVNAAFNNANTLFARERQERSSADEAITTQLDIQASRLGQAEAAITAETETRVNKDNAIAAAVNRIWAAIGGNTAVISDGQLAQVTPSTAQASRWTQVQSEVIDPNTGASRVAAIRQDFQTYASTNDSRLRAMWTVRVETQVAGRAIVGGVGLALNSDGTAQGTTIDFGVRADKFWVGSTSGQGDIPFIVQTSPTTVGGITRPAGTYIRDAFIANGTIDSAKIQDAAITRAKIGVAEIDTLRLAGESVFVPRYASEYFSSFLITPSIGIITSMWLPITGLNAGEFCSVLVNALVNIYPQNTDPASTVGMGIMVNGNILTEVGTTVASDGQFVGCLGGTSVPNGNHLVQIYVRTHNPGNPNKLTGIVGQVMAQAGKR